MANERDVMWVDGVAPGGEPSTFPNSAQLAMLNDVEVDDEEDAEQVTGYGLKPDPFNLVKGSESSGGVGTGVSMARMIFDGMMLRNPVSWVLSSVTGPISELFIIKTEQRNHELIEKYHKCLCFLLENAIPPAIEAVFDVILRHDKYGMEDDSSTDEPYLSLVDKLKQPAFMESGSTKDLRNLLLLTLEVLNDVLSIASKIKAKLELEGFLLKGTPEHTLCQHSCLTMINFLKRLQVLSPALREKFSLSGNQEEISAVSKISCDRWPPEIKTYLMENIQFSMASEVELWYVMTCDSMIGMTVTLCYHLESLVLTSSQRSDLQVIISDFTISVKDLKNSVQAAILNYEHSVKLETEMEKNMKSQTIQANFSREFKLKRHCKDLANLLEDFAQHTLAVENIASQLAHLEMNGARDTVNYRELVETLKLMQETSDCYTQQVCLFVNSKMVLINDLSPKVESLLTASSNYATNNSEPSANHSTPNEEPHLMENPQPSEFENADQIESNPNEESATTNRDEVFVGLFCEIDEEGNTVYQEQPKSEDTVTQALYTGVVQQLKSALIPVKTQMELREKEAVTKFYGNRTRAMNDDFSGNDADEENSPEGTGGEYTTETEPESETEREQSSESEDNPVPEVRNRNYVNKYNAIRDSMETPSTSSCTFNSSNDFLKELRLKLNIGPSEGSNSGVTDEEEEEELAFEPASEGGPVDENESYNNNNDTNTN